MTFNSAPPQDWYESTIDQFYDWGLGTIHVKDVPLITFPTGKKVYITIDAKKTTMQVVEVDGWDSTAKTMNVSSITTERGDGLAYTAQDHWIGASVQISDPYEVRKNIEDAIGNIDSGTVKTNSQDVADGKFADEAARDAYFTSPVDGNSAYIISLGVWTDRVGGAWVQRATGSTPNATDTSSGKVRLADQTQVDAGTDTESGDPLVVIPSTLKVITDDIYGDIALVSNIAGIYKQMIYGDGSDGNVSISGTVTLTRDMYYNNLEIPSGQILDPNGYRIFVKGTISGVGTIRRNGNDGQVWSTTYAVWGAAATTLNQWSLNAEVAAGAGGAWGNNASWGWGAGGTAANPSLTNITWAAGGYGGGYTWGTGAGSGGDWGVSTRGALYNKTFFPLLIHPATAQTTFAGLNYKSIAGSGGWGGWGGSGTTGGDWGGWGGNGGFIWIAVYEWNFTGAITQNGGAGGNGLGRAWYSNHAWGWGWGAGGNGGILFRIYHTLTSDATITQAWGAGGVWAAGYNNGGAGANGATGATGETISIVI